MAPSGPADAICIFAKPTTWSLFRCLCDRTWMLRACTAIATPFFVYGYLWILWIFSKPTVSTSMFLLPPKVTRPTSFLASYSVSVEMPSSSRYLSFNASRNGRPLSTLLDWYLINELHVGPLSTRTFAGWGSIAYIGQLKSTTYPCDSKYLTPWWVPSCLPRVGSSHSIPSHSPFVPATCPIKRIVAQSSITCTRSLTVRPWSPIAFVRLSERARTECRNVE